MYSFEDASVPEVWRTAGPGSLRTTTRHCRGGERSLAWSWEADGALRCTDVGLDTAAQAHAGIKAWIYCESPIDGELTFEFGTAEQVDADQPRCSFAFKLGFSGWRACWVDLGEDAAQYAEPGPLDVVRIKPPRGVEAGTVFFDAVEFVPALGIRSADFQLPFLKHADDPFHSGFPLSHFGEPPRIPLPDAMTDADRREIDTIRRRYEFWLLGTNDNSLDDLPADAVEQVRQYIQQGWDGYRELGIRQDDEGWLTGPGLALRRNENSFHAVFNIILPLAFDYRLNGNREALDTAMQLFDYVADQGWAEGSALGNTFLNILVFAAYCHSIYLLRDELRETGRHEHHFRAAMWYLNFGKAFRAHDTPEQETNTDELRSTVFTALPVLLSMDDSPQKVQYLRSWRDWWSSALPIAPKFAGMLKPDGTGWHHRGIYTVAYTGEAYEMTSLIMFLTRDTSYAADSRAVRNLADALRTEYIMSRGWAMPHGVRGRMLGREAMNPGAAPWYAMLVPFAYLAMADDAVREQMGGLFMRLWDPTRPQHDRVLALSLYLNFPCKATVGRRIMLEQFAAEKLAPAEDPQGLWIKPWGGLAVLRGEGWTLTVKGYSQYVWDFECHPGQWAAKEENVFGRYVSNGHAQPMATYRDDAPVYLGQNLDAGFNFCRFPGITCKQVPLEMIYDPKTTWQTRWFSDETFLGGAQGTDGVGCFAMKLHDTCFDPSFRAIKSWFFFGDHVICLGSDIQCEDADHHVETTLFQAHLPESDRPIHVDGETVTDLPWKVERRDALTLIDPYDIGYVVPAGQHAIAQRGHQAGRDIRNAGDAEGDYATAYFDHGPAPEGAGYEYAILMRTTPDATRAFAAAPPYRVLQRDAVAHIVEHPGRGAIGYCIFTPDRELAHGPVIRTDTPVAAVVSTDGDDRLTLRVADPDLHLPRKANFGFLTARDVERHAESRVVRILIRGQWRLEGDSPDVQIHKYNDFVSLLEFTCQHGATFTANLARVESTPNP